MERFPFTKKKLLQQPTARQHKLVSNWLRKFYLDCLNNKDNTSDLSSFRNSYRQLLQWLGDNCPELDNIDTPRQRIEYVANRYHHHKKLSCIGLAEHNLLPNVRTGDVTGSFPWRASVSYKVALDSIRSAFNVGSIFRLADATGFESVIIGGMTPGIENLQVVKTAMGCTAWIPQEKHPDFAAALLAQKRSGYSIIGLETVENSLNYLEFDWPEQGIVVLGNEEYGISQATMKTCDAFVHLPMQGNKNSVNVANAFAVASFQIAFNRKNE
jgi:tRNA G18 (ribose-2'-O)-methylase SpoU